MLHRWPHGRIIRTITMVLAALIAADLAWSSAWGQWQAWQTEGRMLYFIYAIVVAVVSVGILGAGLWLAGFWPKSVDFLIEVEKEMTKVSWPKQNEVVRSTIVIAVMTVVLSVGIFLVDLLNMKWVYDGLFTLGSR